MTNDQLMEGKMPATKPQNIQQTPVAVWSKLPDRQPQYALVAGVDLVVTRYDDQAAVLYGRCQHRGALMADGEVAGRNLVCGVHNWD